jgi:ribosome-associated toxin RatA of RatAB toxin-antitoxin module
MKNKKHSTEGIFLRSMPKIRRHAHVPYSAAQMFDLVNDVKAYPEFLHWCRGARITASSACRVEAAIDIGIGGIHKTFTTRNTLERPSRIGISLVSGPFRRLDGAWRFADSPQGGAEVELDLDYEVSHSPLGVLFSTVFEEVASSQLNAFVRRAKRVYG